MNAMDFGFDEEDDLSSALGTETLAARDMVPEGFDNTPRARVPTEQLIQGRRYLKVDQSANKRNGSKVSKIWQHRSELRALDTPNLDKYWRGAGELARSLLEATNLSNTSWELTVKAQLQSLRKTSIPLRGGQQLPILLCANGRSIRYLALLPHANASEPFHLQRSSLLRRETSYRMALLRPWSA